MSSVVFDTTTKDITSFAVNLGNSNTLPVGTFGLTSLRVLYTAAVTGPPAVSTSLNIVGTIENDTAGAVFTISCIADSRQSATPGSTVTVTLLINSLSDRTNPKSTTLTLSNFVSLLGISSPVYTSPLQCSAFDNTLIKGIEDKIAVTTSSPSPISTMITTTLEILGFDSTVTSPTGFDLLPVWGIQLSQICLNVHYEDQKTTGSTAGYLQINKLGGAWLPFALDKNGAGDI